MQFRHPLPHSRCPTPLGPVTLAAGTQGLAGVWFDDDAHRPATTGWPHLAGHPLLLQAAQELQAYFAGRLRQFTLPLDLDSGSAFEQAVWRALLAVPYGAHTSYGALGARLGKPGASRAVGAALGRNPLSIVVPCHRVLGADGRLTGFAAGLARKQALLELEQAARQLRLDTTAA